MAIGDYPAEYNPKVHGPYDPARYYGKPDTPFSELKLTEIGSWLARRKKSPQSVAGLFSRVYWRWQQKYVLPRRAGIVGAAQFCVAWSALFYWINYNKLKHERRFKYH
ncbi:putative ATP synthase subunit f, mitochondrial [Ixodes scapularis]|uniref:ATP synthase F chain n=1 Tax=Ixodes scapularis TaxID=6945 RepID=Q4PM56_IXOSC|nr:putative ATP synthase subunit f, mitochondrial [Ixodes scapularis]AAY66908.1 mitochondrial ATP synthase F chain [Ixodes scapularis]EEC00200.1 ATP synthase F chain [Ixodes scapularis]|eukprot:XP_002399351.1 ATP synthase F chain [Ixodes scapularis]